ncbi:MAG TPA: stalk domain-containing protein, partial [Candidatus Acidoferrales bacterium]|nr:stalk domain-containing protein [Candidatus Acidoferrales bacterium]
METRGTLWMQRISKRALGSLGVFALVVALALGGSASLAADIPVVVNGQQIQFDQPPIERSGRVFVPLRGVFEHLGASVVY